jgi:RHS repeat-associated protein/uncharacterized delta-60 repeat protein
MRIFAILLLVIVFSGNAQITDTTSTTTATSTAITRLDPLPSAPATVVERGAHHRVFERTRLEPNGLGRLVPRKTSYVELSTGMNYRGDNGQWLPTEELIEIVPNGAVARRGPHKVAFAANINVASPLSIATPDNKRIRCRIMGLAYYDYRSEQRVLIAELKDSIGELVGNNRLVYRDAFTDFKVDVHYVYTKAGLEQFCILRERPPLPEEYGLNPESTRLQIWTEFIESPEPVRRQRVKKRWLQAKEDQVLDFGEMKIGYGTAFAVPGQNKQQGVTMDKEWAVVNDRNFLIEDVGFRWVKPHLRELRPAGQAGLKKESPDGVLHVVSINPLVPAKKLASVESTNQILVASLAPEEPGFALDWGLVTTQTNVFYPDMTYCVNGQVNIDSDVVFHGGSIIKFKPGATLRLMSAVQCNTDVYRPIVFTASSDNTLGEQVDAGSPTTHHAEVALWLDNGGNLKHMRFLHAKTAIRSTHNVTIKHSQIVHCGWGLDIENADFSALNILMSDVGTNFHGALYDGRVEHLTAHLTTTLTDDRNFPYEWTGCEDEPTSTIDFVNALFVGVSDYGVVPVSFDHCRTPAITAFQSAVSGNYYVHDDDPDDLRDTGTSDIDTGLAAELKGMTTHRPVVYINQVTPSGTLQRASQSIRDETLLDHGFHYYALDYAFGGCDANQNLTFGPGVAAGWFRTTSGWEHAGHGIHVADQKIVTFDGRVDATNYWVRCNTVQEGGNGLWEGGYGPGGITGWADQNLENVALSPELHARFTRFSLLAGEPGLHFRDDNGYLIARARDCEFRGGGIAGYVLSCYLTNCLMEYAYGGQIAGLPGNEYHLRNCTWIGSSITIDRWYSPIPLTIKDCAFDKTAFNMASAEGSRPNSEYDFNAFLTGAPRPTIALGNNVIVDTFQWQSDAYGKFYQPINSPLINEGSRHVAAADLASYTSIGTERDRGNVDIGLHYPYVGPPYFYVGKDQHIVIGQQAQLHAETHLAVKGKVFVSHDEWPLSDFAYGVGLARKTSADAFALKVAKWFMNGGQGDFLVYSVSHGLTGNKLKDTMTSPAGGHTWTIAAIDGNDPATALTLQTLLEYDGVFLAGITAHPVNPAVLVAYVNAGGNVFIEAGTFLSGEFAITAPTLWNAFLNEFNLQYEHTPEGYLGYNSVEGYLPVSSRHSTLNGVQLLYHNNGNTVSEVAASNPSTEILEHAYSEGDLQGLFGIFAEPVPGMVWCKQSGPGTVSFANRADLNTTATFSWPGTYRLVLKANSCAASSASPPVTVYVNGPPTVLVSAQNTVTLVNGPGGPSGTLVLNGTVLDLDNLPLGRQLAISWTVVDGPARVTLQPTAAAPEDGTATFYQPGKYRLRLYASDTELSASKDLQVTVKYSVNSPATVDAGPDQTIAYPGLVYLPGAVTDVDADPLEVEWSGPWGVTFAHPNSAATFASFSSPGIYVLTLTAYENEALVRSDTVQITVNPPDSRDIFNNTDVTSASFGGLRNIGHGTLHLAGIHGEVKRAFLYWHGPTDTYDPNGNAHVVVNGRLVVGQNVGFSQNNGWAYDNNAHEYANSQAYRADVTTLVKTFGNGAYTLEKFFKSEVLNINGASLIVFHDDGNAANNRDIVLFGGNDSNVEDKFRVFFDVHSLSVQPDSKILIGGNIQIINDDLRTGIGRLNGDGTLDVTFDPGHGFASGVNDIVLSMALQNDNRIVIGGSFDRVNEITRNHVARLHADGVLDESFDPGTGANGDVKQVAVHRITVGANTEERVLVAGVFTEFNGQSRNRLVRLMPNGAIDSLFSPDVSDEINALAIDHENRILIGGRFTTVNGQPRNYLARLNETGTLDETFNPTPGLSGIGGQTYVHAILEDSSEKILIGGYFLEHNGTPRQNLARLNSDGSLDTTFDPGSGTDADILGNAAVLAMTLSGTQLYIGGKFTAVNGFSRKRIARLTSTGAVDLQFDPGDGVSFSTDSETSVNALAVHGDKVLIGGKFTRVDDKDVPYLARLNSDGSVDRTAYSKGWFFEIPGVNYIAGKPASLELHVSDGQHSEDTELFGVKEYYDPDIIITSSLGTPGGGVFIQPEERPRCGPDGPADWQIFAGYTSFVSTNHQCIENLNLWDVRNFDGLETFLVPGTQTLSISTSDDRMETLPGPIEEDAISLVAALVKLPPGAVPPTPGAPVVAPLETPPTALADHATVNRSLGMATINVLGNDWSADGTLLSVTSVSRPQSGLGAAEVIYDRSAVRYRAKPGVTGTDSFSYTVQDKRGNTATATVTVTIVGAQSPVLLSGSQTVQGNLSVNGTRTTVRGGNQYADFYQFEGRANDEVDITLTPEVFAGHVFLRDFNGNLVVSGAHDSGAALRVADIQDFILPSDGLYTIEVTAHSATETGPYTLEFGLASSTPQPRLELLVDGIVVPHGGLADLGPALTKEIEIVNRGNAVYAAFDSGIWWPFFVLTPPDTFIADPIAVEPIPPQTTRTILVTVDQTVRGTRSGSFKVDGDPEYEIQLKGFVNPANAPLPAVTIEVPIHNTVATAPTNISVNVEAIAQNNMHFNNATITKVELFAASATGQIKVGESSAAQNGVYTFLWVNPAVGIYALRATATVTATEASTSLGVEIKGESLPVSVTVIPSRRNSAPIAVDDTNAVAAISPLSQSQPNRLDVLANDQDPDADALRIVSVNGQQFGVASIAEDGRSLIYTPHAGVFGFDYLFYRVSDGRNGFSSARVRVNIVDQSVEITEPLDQDVFTTQPPQPPPAVTLEATAAISDGVIARIEYYANDIKIGDAFEPPYRVIWLPPAMPKFYRLKAVLLSDDGLRTDSEAITIGYNTGAAHSPLASIDNLEENQLVREGQFDLRGTADDATLRNDVRYRVDLYKPTEGGLIALANVTPSPLDSEGYRASYVASGGILASLDFSTLRNGTYLLRLTVDNGAAFTTREVPFVLESAVKLGQLTFSEQDLTVSASGIPISIVRSYDSFNPDQGDFGYSWSLSINNLDVELDEERKPDQPKDPDEPQGEKFSMRVGGGRNMTLTLPDGRRTTFRYTLEPGPSEGGVPCFCYEAKWRAAPGIFARLAPTSNNRLIYIPWQPGEEDAIPPHWQASGPGTPMENFDFPGFVLTNIDGTEYHITRETEGDFDLPSETGLILSVRAHKKPKLGRVVTKAGDTIEISEEAGTMLLKHFTPTAASPAELTRTVTLKRNAAGQVTDVFGPEAIDPATGELMVNAPAAVKYFYTADNLTEVQRLVDRANADPAKRYLTTRYRYTHPIFPHYLTQIVTVKDNAEIVVLDNVFDDTGRLVQSSAPGQTGPNFERDLSNRREIVVDTLGNRTVLEYDTRGNITRSVNAMGEMVSRTYDDQNNVLTETDGLNQTTTFSYDSAGNQTETVDPGGNKNTAEFQEYGLLKRTRDANFNAVPPRPADQYTTENTYHLITKNLLTSKDAYGNLTTYEYEADSNGQPNGPLKKITDAVGNLTEYKYYAGTGVGDDFGGRAGDLKSVTVKLKRDNPPAAPEYIVQSVTRYEYNSRGNRFKETVFRNVSTTPASDPIETRFFYDDQDRLYETQNPLWVSSNPDENVNRTIYNEFGRAASTMDALGRTTTYDYDARGNLVQTTYPHDAETPVSVSRTVYDEMNRPIYIQDAATPDGQNVTMAPGSRTVYDAAGRTIRTERLDKFRVEMLTVNQFPSTRAVPNANHSGNLPAQFDVLSSTSRSYDKAGRVSTSTDANGNVTTYEYDASGRRVAMRNALGQVTRYEYDANGNQKAMVDARGTRTTYDYDDLNRLFEVLYPDETTETTGYDKLGRRVQHVDQEGKVTQFQFDALGRLTAVTNALGTTEQAITRYKYDGAGNLVEQLDANQSIKPEAQQKPTRFEYDKLGRRTRRFLPESTTAGPLEEITYQTINKRLHKTVQDFAGEKVLYRHDVRDRLKQKGLAVTAPATFTPLVSYTYTPGGQRLQMFDAFGRTDYQYDGHNRLAVKQIFERQPDGQISSSPIDFLTYHRDPQGNLTGIGLGDYPATISYQWDSLNRLVAVTNTLSPVGELVGGVLRVLPTRYSYDQVGNLKTSALPSSIEAVYTYNDLNRLTDLVVTKRMETGTEPRASFTYGLRDSGHRSGVTEVLYGVTRNVTYTYDARYRLTREQISGSGSVGEIDYRPQPGSEATTGYDLVGNRRSRNVTLNPPVPVLPNVVRTFTYDANDRLASPEIYDPNGNTLQGDLDGVAGIDQSANDIYDFEDRLVTRHPSASTTINLVYDGDGNRVLKKITAGGVTTKRFYLVDDQNPTGYPQVLREWTHNGTEWAVAHMYVWGRSLISEQHQVGGQQQERFYSHDGHGSVRFLSDHNGNITDTYTYDAFGILIGQTGGGTPNNYLYASEEWDPDLRQSYNTARYMNPHSGRFWTMDPFEGRNPEPLSLHKYLYAEVNPVNGTDPLGTFTASLKEQLFVGGTILTLSAVHVMQIAQRAGPAGLPTFRLPTAATRQETATQTTRRAQPEPERKPYPWPIPLDEDLDERYVFFHYSQSPASSFANGLMPPAWVTDASNSGLDSQTAMFDFGIAPPLYEYAFRIRLDMLGPGNNSNPGRRSQYPVMQPTGPDSLVTWRDVPQTHGTGVP